MNDFVKGGFRQKFLYGVTAARVLPRRQQVSLAIFPPEEKTSSASRDCILLHGWGLDGSAMMPLLTAMRQLPGAGAWRFWNVTYDTEWTSFARSSSQVLAALYQRQPDFAPALLIGYSMGNVVARQMVASGFPCAALVSICGPHLGAAPWLLSGAAGPRSVRRGSRPLRRLNRNAIDMAHRKHYHLFGITYRDALGEHQHDGVIPIDSALGVGLGEMASRTIMPLRYRSVATWDPHWRGKTTACIGPVLERISGLLSHG